MVLLRSCCCGLMSMRSASYCAAFYACIYFLVTLAVSALGVVSLGRYGASPEDAQHPDQVDLTAKGLLTLMIVLSALGVASAIMLVLGLCKERRWLLVPILCTLSSTIVLDLAAVTTVIVQDTLSQKQIDATALTLLVIDLMAMSVNLWCVLCVVSQYQIYKASAAERDQSSIRYRAPLSASTDNSAAIVPLSPMPAMTTDNKGGRPPENNGAVPVQMRMLTRSDSPSHV